jgi:hypothetical protein
MLDKEDRDVDAEGPSRPDPEPPILRFYLISVPRTTVTMWRRVVSFKWLAPGACMAPFLHLAKFFLVEVA